MTTHETREMRLISRLIANSDDAGEDTTLAQFIARRRVPGPQWRSWDEVMVDLSRVIHEVVGTASLRKWASRYGIPQCSDAEGKAITSAEYHKALRKSGITLN